MRRHLQSLLLVDVGRAGVLLVAVRVAAALLDEAVQRLALLRNHLLVLCVCRKERGSEGGGKGGGRGSGIIIGMVVR